MEMSTVAECNFTVCAYNNENRCHAMAINVGGPDGPMCDTFARSSIKCGSTSVAGEVGACRISGCLFNDCLECDAGQIKVRNEGEKPVCGTFKARNGRMERPQT
jgi:hypothetical protein